MTTAITPSAAPTPLVFEEFWEEKGLEFTADIEDGVMACYDESMLEIVWNNLLSNAIKFSNTSGKVKISLKTVEKYAEITVKDTGCGMDEATRKHIFDKFYQGDTSHSQEGNGLGLALVMKVISICEGSISVNSKPGEGSTFTVKLKLTIL